jgi:hypothetical protein
MTDDKKHLATLQGIAATPVNFLPNLFAVETCRATAWALAEIERLTTENAEEVQRVADFAILFEQLKLEEERLTTENKDLRSQLEWERKQWNKKAGCSAPAKKLGG